MYAAAAHHKNCYLISSLQWCCSRTCCMCEMRCVSVYLIRQLPQHGSICFWAISGQCRSVTYHDTTICQCLKPTQVQYWLFACSPRSADMQCIWTHLALHLSSQRQQLLDCSCGVASLHQALPNKDGAAAGRLHRVHVCGCEDPALPRHEEPTFQNLQHQNTCMCTVRRRACFGYNTLLSCSTGWHFCGARVIAHRCWTSCPSTPTAGKAAQPPDTAHRLIALKQRPGSSTPQTLHHLPRVCAN